MRKTSKQKKVAIACQGGGSHTAFTAGVLSHLAENWRDEHKFVGISGTSGGGLCAALFWAAAVEGDLRKASSTLQAFWHDNSARSPWDATVNNIMGATAALKGIIPMLELSPYQFPDWAGEHFRSLLDRHFDFKLWESLKQPDSPLLQLGAVEVVDGDFTVFDSSQQIMRREMLEATAAIPNIFRAVDIDGKKYWDGLFSHNPPILSLLSTQADEIWIVQVNPKRASVEPRTVEEIEDRRNELAGNLSLEQEVAALDQINSLLRKGCLENSNCRYVKHHKITLECQLNYASKLERSPSFIEQLVHTGRQSAKEFTSQFSNVVKC